MARGLMLTEKKAVYVEALKSIGYSDMRIIFVHIMPNVVATMIAQFTMDIGAAIVAMASLSYLGVGIQPPDADWGSLLQDGMNSFSNNMILLAAPAILIMIVSISINLFSDGIQQYLDPSERKLPTFRQFEKRLLRMEFKGKTQECKAA
jgi:peptide/nickel transport system permease protein